MIPLELTVKTDFSGPQGGTFRIYPIGDIHLDNRGCDEDRLKEYLKLISSDPYCCWFILGDLIDGTTPDHRYFKASVVKPGDLQKMDDYVTWMTERLLAVLAPLKGIPGVVLQGNHDRRRTGLKWAGLSWSIAASLGAEYGETEALVRLIVREKGSPHHRHWIVHAQHGAGGGYLPGGKINRFQHTATVTAEADIFLRSHLHDADARVIPRYALSLPRGSGKVYIRSKPIAYVTAASFKRPRTSGVCDYEGIQGIPPGDQGLWYLECVNERRGNEKHPLWEREIFRHEARI